MTEEEIISFVTTLGGVLTMTPAPGDGSPEISWGDTFFYYSRDGETPAGPQPFATIVTKDYPDEERPAGLNRPDAFRVNIAAGKQAFIDWLGHAPTEPAGEVDPSVTDTVMAHPVYGSLSWLAVVNPGPRTDTATRDLLRTAHHLARSRAQRRGDSTSDG